MNKEEKDREIKYIRLGLIWSDNAERGFYLLPEDAAGIVDLIHDRRITRNGSKILMYEIIKRNKDIAKKAYEILLEKNLIKK